MLLDGDSDIVSSSYGLEPRLLLNDGAGQFTDATPSRIELATVAAVTEAVLADFDRDGALDAAVDSPPLLLWNDGRGWLSEASLPSVPGLGGTVAAADVDRDADIDLVFGHGIGPYCGQPPAQLALNTGGRRFVDETGNLPRAPCSVAQLAAGDLNGDGAAEIVLLPDANSGINSPRLWVNDGAGVFSDRTFPQLPWCGPLALAVALGDVDRDLDLDLAFAVFGQDRLLLNDGTGRFTDATASRVPPDTTWSSDTKFLDADGDGDLDWLSADRGSPSGWAGVRLLCNDGLGRFQDATQTHMPPNQLPAYVLFAGDMDQDGDGDLVSGYLKSPWVTNVYQNDGTGRFVDVTAARAPVGDLMPMALGDLDGDQDPDLVAMLASRYPRMMLNVHRQLHAPLLARVGQPWFLAFFARAGYAGGGEAAVPYLSTVPAMSPIAVPPFGRFGLSPAQTVTLPAVALPAPRGMGAIVITIPPDPALAGMPAYAQALILDPAGFAAARLTGVVYDPVLR